MHAFLQDIVEAAEKVVKNNADLPIVSGSLPLDKLYQWCKEEGYKVSAELTVRADNIKPVIVKCDSISSVEDFAEHIGNDR
jgi:hypothetical protein